MARPSTVLVVSALIASTAQGQECLKSNATCSEDSAPCCGGLSCMGSGFKKKGTCQAGCMKDNTPGCNMFDTNPGCCSGFCDKGLCDKGCWGKAEGDRCEANFKCCDGFMCVDSKCKKKPAPTPNSTPGPSGWEELSCAFTLTLNRSYGEKFSVKASGLKNDTFAVGECSTTGVGYNNFSAASCIKDGYGKGINSVKNQRGEVVAYGNCCNEVNAVVSSSDCQSSSDGIGDCACPYTTATANYANLTIEACAEWFNKGCPNSTWPGEKLQPKNCGKGANAIGFDTHGKKLCRVYACPEIPRTNAVHGWHCYYKKLNETITII